MLEASTLGAKMSAMHEAVSAMARRFIVCRDLVSRRVVGSTRQAAGCVLLEEWKTFNNTFTESMKSWWGDAVGLIRCVY